MKEAEAARGCGGSTGFAALGKGFAARVKVFGVIVFQLEAGLMSSPCLVCRDQLINPGTVRGALARADKHNVHYPAELTESMGRARKIHLRFEFLCSLGDYDCRVLAIAVGQLFSPRPVGHMLLELGHSFPQAEEFF
jgi:hypothetical protein